MPMIVDVTLECTVCQAKTKGTVTFTSPQEWIVDAPGDWMVRQKADEDDDSMLIFCDSDCELRHGSTAQA